MEAFFQFDLLLQMTLGVAIFSLLLGTLFTAVVLLGASYLLPGVHVTNFTNALILAVVTALIVFGITYLLSAVGITGGFIGGIVGLAVTTAALLIADRVLDGVRIDSWVWALVVAILVGVANLLVPGSGIL